MVRFMGRLARVGVVTAIFGAMCGCAGSLQPKTLDTGTSLKKEIRVRTHDLSGKTINEGIVRDALAAVLISGGKTPTSYGEQYVGEYQNSKTFNTKGIRSKATAAGIEVEYLAGTKVTSPRTAPTFYESRIAATFPLTLSKSEDGEMYKAVLGFPAQVSMTPPPFMPFAKPAYALKDEQVVPNLMSKFNALKEVAIPATAQASGEVTVDTAPDAVRGNLERILGRYQDWQNAYSFEVQGHKQPLYVKLYPYKTGCKMQWSIDIPYTVSETTSLTEADLKAVKQKVESVARD